MRTRASTQEFEDLLAQLDPLREEMRTRRPPMTEEEISARVVGIARMVFAIVGICPACDEPVRRCDSRRLVQHDGEQRLAHIPCLKESE
jgi:hypothetical protein